MYACEDDLGQHLTEILRSNTDIIAKSHVEGSFVTMLWET